MESQPLQLVFESSQFPVLPGEDDEVNPGIYGKALAAWLSDQLAKRSYRVKRMGTEDFGYLIHLEDPDFQLYLACASTDSTATEWRVFSFAEFGWIAWLLRRRDKRAVISKLMRDVKAILLESPSTRNLREE